MDVFDLFANIWVYLLAIAIFPIVIAGIVRKSLRRIWCYIEFCALLVGAVGFLIPAFTVQQMAYKMEAERQEGFSRGQLHVLRQKTHILINHCSPLARSEFSPNDFDLVVEESALLCSWATNLDSFIGELSSSNYREIPDQYISIFPSVTKAGFLNDKDQIRKAIDCWNAHVMERQDVEEKARRDVPIALIFFSPYLLAFAFSLTAAGILFKPRH